MAGLFLFWRLEVVKRSLPSLLLNMSDIDLSKPNETKDLEKEMDQAQEVVAAPDTSFGLSTNVASGLAALLGLLGGIVFFFVEKKNQTVRKWAAQSIVFWGGVSLSSILISICRSISGMIPVLGSFFGLLFSLIYVVVVVCACAYWVMSIINAFTGKTLTVPVVTPLAESLLKKFPGA